MDRTPYVIVRKCIDCGAIALERVAFDEEHDEEDGSEDCKACGRELPPVSNCLALGSWIRLE